MNLEKDLQQFGFDDKKAKVYLATLELGAGKAYEIAKKTKLGRPTVYEVLNKLIQDGFISMYEKRGVKQFVAEDPEKIQKRLADKQRLFADLMPELESIHNSLRAKPKVKYYEGVEGVKTILEDTLTAKDKKLWSILSISDLYAIPGRPYMDDYVARRIKQGVHLRVVRAYPENLPEQWPTNQPDLRVLRYAPPPMRFSMTMYIYNNKVSLISSLKENFGMIIESDEFSENLRNLFEALWKVSTPDKSPT